MRNEWKDLAEKLLFDFGKAVLGDNSGGQIVKLMKARGIDGARNAIKAAAGKSSPCEYIGAVLLEPGPQTIQVGEKMGGYVWNGRRWAEESVPGR